MSGWIKLHRSITEHWLYTEKRKFSKFEAWNDILLTVNYLPCKTIIKGKVIEVKRGESALSLESWGKRWNWDKSSVKRFFELLKSDDMIQLKNETVTTRLIICNYDSYQSKENEVVTQTKRRRNADETQTKPIEEEEESKEEKEEIYRAFKHLKLTIDEFKKLNEVYLKEDIETVLNNIENYKTNNKYSSLYLTSLNWLKKDYKTKEESIKNHYKISV
jgi:hypothetical protein